MVSAEEKVEKYFGTVALIGAPNAGKSTLLNAILGHKIAPTSRKPQTTRRQLRGVLTQGNTQVVFVDTPGMLSPAYELQGYMQKQAETILADVDLVVWVVDSTKTTRNNWSAVLDALKKANVARVIVAFNKIDFLKDKKLLLPLIEEWQSKYSFTTFIAISALKKQGIEAFLELIHKQIGPGEWLFSEDFLTDAAEKEIVAELIREKAMERLGDELPYQIAVTIDAFDETRRENSVKPLVTIEAVIHVERDSQKAIVIGKQGSQLKAIGTSARKTIETLVGCKVMLKLFVRVEADWSKSAKSLKKLGYR